MNRTTLVHDVDCRGHGASGRRSRPHRRSPPSPRPVPRPARPARRPALPPIEPVETRDPLDRSIDRRRLLADRRAEAARASREMARIDMEAAQRSRRARSAPTRSPRRASSRQMARLSRHRAARSDGARLRASIARRWPADGADRAPMRRGAGPTSSPDAAPRRTAGRARRLGLPPGARHAQSRRLRPRGADVQGHRAEVSEVGRTRTISRTTRRARATRSARRTSCAPRQSCSSRARRS